MVAAMNRLPLLLALLLAACPERKQAPVEAAAVQQPSIAAAIDAGITLTPAKLDAWLTYHQRLRAFVSDDGGALDMKAKAKRERALREELQLSELELDALEELVGAVVAQRTISRLTGAEAVKEFDKVTLSLKAEQREKVEQAFGDVRTRAQAVASLDAERAKFGADAVSMVLAREAEVTATWDALLDGKGERR